MNTISVILFATITFGGLKLDTPYRVQYDGITSSIVRFSNESGQLSIPQKRSKNVGMHIIIDAAGRLAKEIEWLYSGDTGESELKRVALPIIESLKAGVAKSD